MQAIIPVVVLDQRPCCIGIVYFVGCGPHPGHPTPGPRQIPTLDSDERDNYRGGNITLGAGRRSSTDPRKGGGLWKGW
jgi:hypothetical protein